MSSERSFAGPGGSPGGYGLQAALITEVVLTAVFFVVIMGATSKRAAAAMEGLATGLVLALIHGGGAPLCFLYPMLCKSRFGMIVDR